MGWIPDHLLLEGDEGMYCFFFALPLAYNIWCFLWPKSSIRGTKEALFNGSYIHRYLTYMNLKEVVHLFLRSTQGSS